MARTSFTQKRLCCRRTWLQTSRSYVGPSAPVTLAENPDFETSLRRQSQVGCLHSKKTGIRKFRANKDRKSLVHTSEMMLFRSSLALDFISSSRSWNPPGLPFIQQDLPSLQPPCGEEHKQRNNDRRSTQKGI